MYETPLHCRKEAVLAAVNGMENTHFVVTNKGHLIDIV